MSTNESSINGQALREMRESMGWTQKELGMSLTPPISASSISSYELGRTHTPRKISMKELEELSSNIVAPLFPRKKRTKKNSDKNVNTVIHLLTENSKTVNGEKEIVGKPHYNFDITVNEVKNAILKNLLDKIYTNKYNIDDINCLVDNYLKLLETSK